MEYKFKFYLWAIDKLRRRRMTLTELTDEWENSHVNDEHRALSRRTFFRYKDDILSLFGIDIECDIAGGNKYYIRRSMFEDNETIDWLLSSLRMSTLAGRMQQHENVMLEPPPRNAELLNDFLFAIEHRYAVSFHYATPFGKEFDTVFIPAFLRLFQQRWYVIGQRAEDKAVRTLAFDRISRFEVLQQRCLIDKKVARLLKPDKFFKDSFGIIRDDNLKAETVRIGVFWPEDKFIEETPLHPSQHCVYREDGYAEYELTVQATRDFKQQLLWHGRKLIVVSPQSLRDEMIKVLEDMRQSYLTQENLSGD